MLKKISRPNEGEDTSQAAGLINLVPADKSVLQHLSDNCKIIKNLILSLHEEKLLYQYAEGKWTIKELLVHITDTERIMSYRALCFARQEFNTLPGYEQDDYVRNSNANFRDIKNILEEYEAVRHSTIALFNGIDDDMLLQMGSVNKNKISVRALAYRIAGHELHHLKVIREKYL